MKGSVHQFQGELQIIGINPFVFVPDRILNALFKVAGRDRGPIPIRGSINGHPYRQTLVKFRGAWRLYVNTTMLPASPERIGERIVVKVAYDPTDRTIEPPEAFVKAMAQHTKARRAFDRLPPSRQKEVIRYLAALKSEKALARNVDRMIAHLLGLERFLGRDPS